MATQIASMPLGTNIELRLKNTQKLRGARGEVSDSVFTLVDSSGGGRQIAFDDVTSVKQFTKKSHTTRNILIGVGIGFGAIALVVVVAKATGAGKPPGGIGPLY